MAVKYTQRKALLHKRRMTRPERQARAESRRLLAFGAPKKPKRPLSDLRLLIEGPGYKRTDLGLVSGLLQAMRGKGYKREVQAG